MVWTSYTFTNLSWAQLKHFEPCRKDNKSRPVNKRCAIVCARLFTCLTKARRAIHRMPKIYIIYRSWYWPLWLFSFRICEKTWSCGLDFKENFLLYMGQPRIIFSRPSKVQVVVKMSSIMLRKKYLNVSKIIIFAESSYNKRLNGRGVVIIRC